MTDRERAWLDAIDRAMTVLGWVVVGIGIGFLAAHIAVYVIFGGNP